MYGGADEVERLLSELMDVARRVDGVEDNDFLWFVVVALRGAAGEVEALAMPGLGGVAMRRLNELKPPE